MSNPIIYVSPILGALIGWITNYIAILLLFRPQRPIRIPVIGYTLQGLLPKYRDDLAYNLGATLEQELFSFQDVVKKLEEENSKEEILKLIVTSVSERVNEKLPRFLPENLRTAIGVQITSFLSNEISEIFDDALDKLGHYMTEKISVQKMVEEKLMLLDLDELETMARKLAARELKHIEVLGGVLGFIIGLVQAVVLLFLM
jgi:uncharacterized membrane protein YheB (UPF0754 family)